MRILIALLVAILLLALAGLALVGTGAYNVAADAPHGERTAAIIEYARERSIARRIRDIEVPALDDAALVAEGAEHYAAMCTGCHLAPGLADTELRQGLYPQPPDLTKRRVRGSPQRSFWILKHGLKLTGMPAWGTTHDDASLWGIVAFLGKLPEMSAEEYAQLTRKPEPAPDTPQQPPEHDHSTHRH